MLTSAWCLPLLSKSYIFPAPHRTVDIVRVFFGIISTAIRRNKQSFVMLLLEKDREREREAGRSKDISKLKGSGRTFFAN